MSRRSLLGALVGGSASLGLAACTQPSGSGGGPGPPAWYVSNFAGTLSISGYVDRPSVNRGEDLTLHLNCIGSDAGSPVVVAVHRTGWYGGQGASTYVPPTTITAPLQQPATAVVDPVSLRCEASWEPVLTISTETGGTPWPTGTYVFQLTGTSGKQAYVPFTVRDDASTSPYLFVNNHMTWWAYNNEGGYNLYNGGSEVGPQRPFRSDPVRNSQGAGEYFWLEYRMVRWLERNGFDVSYVADFDLDLRPVPDSTQAIVLAGHSEYWTGRMRANVDDAMAQRGVGVVSFGANTCYWRGRLEGTTATAPGHYVCWKSPTGFASTADPLQDDPALATMLFRRIPGLAEHYMLGGGFQGWVDANAYVPGPALNSTALHFTDVSHPVFAGTGIVSGQEFPGLCGGEFDWWDPVFGPNPGTTICDTPLDVVFSNHHPLLVPDHQQSSVQEKSFPGGVRSRVFNAGTYTWTWGLDNFSFEDFAFAFANPRIQQLTGNILRWAAKEI